MVDWLAQNGPLISADQLSLMLRERDVIAIDATYYAPSEHKSAAEAFAQSHIPDARFFDIETVADRLGDVPHILPSKEDFERHMGRLGIFSDAQIVVYDRHYLRSAPRVWWTFRRFGHRGVMILDGGLEAWVDGGLPIEVGLKDGEVTDYVSHPEDQLVRHLGQVIANAKDQDELYLDAREPDRFSGLEGDSWTHRRGHILGSRNLPAAKLRGATGRLRCRDELEDLLSPFLKEEGIVATCGSGISAALLAFAFYVLGREDVAVYDGSWAEWAGRPETEALTDAA